MTLSSFYTCPSNKCGFSVVLVGGGQLQKFVRPWQLKVTRGDHFLIDLINATDVEADVNLEMMLLIYHRANFRGIRVKQSCGELFLKF